MTALARLAAVLGAVLAGATFVVSPASAGTYSVKACADAKGQENLAWSFVETGASGQLQHGSNCQGSGEFGGLWVYDNLSAGNSNGDVSGFWRFETPTTTTITGLDYSRYLRIYGLDKWNSFARSPSGTLEGCFQVSIDDDFCTVGASGGQAVSFTGLSTSRLEVGIRCASGSSSMFCINGAGIHSAQATLYGATVTISDPQAPTVGALSGGLFAGGWVRGTQTVQLSADDATGIGQLGLTRDGGTVVRSQSFACDDRLPAPCAGSGTSRTSGWAALDTTTLSEGSHSFVGSAVDAGSNTAQTSSVTVQVDNTPPAAPVGLSAGSQVWTQTAMRSLAWTLPGSQASPITAAQVSVCKSGGSCFSPAATTTGSSFSLPSEGFYTASVKLVDAAGNVTVNPATVTLGWDQSAAQAPVLGQVQNTSGTNYSLTVDIGNDPGPAPIASLVGEACPQAGGACRPFSSTGGTSSVSFSLPTPGPWTITVRTVDAAGNTSPNATTSYTVPGGPTSTPMPTPTPTPSASPTPTASASPTATPTPRRAPGLKITKAKLVRARVVVRGRLATGATGRVTIAAKGRKRALAVANGSFAGSLKLSRRTKRVRLLVAYEGDAAYLPRTRVRTLRRR